MRYLRLFQYIFKKHGEQADNSSIRIYVNEIEITFRVKTEYYLKLLMPETLKLFGSTKSKIIKNKNGENVPHLEITEVVVVHRNIVQNNYQQHLFIINHFVNY